MHSGWLQADFDLKDNSHLANAQAEQEIRQKLLSDPYVGVVFCGPSGEGIKAIVRINGERHKESWFAAEAYFFDHYGLKLDRSTKDPLRLCFVSYDPLAELSSDFTPLPIPESQKQQGEKWYPPVETTAADIREMLSFIPPRPDYDEWLRIASAIWSVLPMGEGCKLLNEWSPEEKEGEYATKHKHKLKQIGIGTLIHIASRYGFDAKAAWKKKRWAGRIRFTDGAYHPAEGEDSATSDLEKILAEQEMPVERALEALQKQQIGDAELWTDIRQGLWVWNADARKWMTYEKGIWRKDDRAILDISETLCRIYSELAKNIQNIADKPAPKEEKDKDPRVQKLKEINVRLKSLTTHNYLRGVEELALKRLQLPATAFDTNPDLLVVANGTLDLAEGVFREHRFSDYSTHKTSVIYDPHAECPAWDAFLNYFMSEDKELISYLRKAVGYCLTGRTDEDVLFYCYGEGANGKSTFFSGLELLFGDLMTTVPIAVLLGDKPDSSHDCHKANMEGMRLVKTDEIPENKKLAEHHVKSLVGGDEVVARRLYENPHKFKPTHKFWVVGNHKLEIRGTDLGIWRRIHLIPWVVTISEEKKRPRREILAEFEKEKSGILNWALCGFSAWKMGGLNPFPYTQKQEFRERSELIAMAKSMTRCKPVQRDLTPGSPSHLRPRKPPKLAIKRITVLSGGGSLGMGLRATI